MRADSRAVNKIRSKCTCTGLKNIIYSRNGWTYRKTSGYESTLPDNCTDAEGEDVNREIGSSSF